MNSLASALSLVDGLVRAGPEEEVPLEAASGRYLAAPLVARRDVPATSCSAMDGWAVRASQAGGPLRASGAIYAGDGPGQALGQGEARRIFTGAPLPDGCDAVVREEQAQARDGWVHIQQLPAPGENVRLAGEDVAAGALALEAGCLLGPRQLGFCAALGVERLGVIRRPRVGLLSTGDEIARGLVPDSNGRTLAHALAALGCEVEARLAPDEPDALARAFAELAPHCDAVVSSGGVSVGERDLVPSALRGLGARLVVHGVAMKPGKPFLAAQLGGRPVFGLPGSPSACLVAFEVFVRPAVLALAGAAERRRRVLRLPLRDPYSGRGGRARFLWARITSEGTVDLLGRDTAQIRGPALAQALVHLPEEVEALPATALVDAWLLDGAAP